MVRKPEVSILVMDYPIKEVGLNMAGKEEL